ncbi:hypothetical protein [Streptomyces sp. NBC_01317]|uniref:hypothetical protein n=1 Tax=Streptomyces sp. NBC_01317 TaxID=2903822 RepID=UPI002E1648C9
MSSGVRRRGRAVGDLGPLLAGVGKAVLSVPDAYVTATVDVTAWADRKWRAILAHRSEAARERSLPGLLSRAGEKARDRVLGTEYYSRLSLVPSPGGPRRPAT